MPAVVERIDRLEEVFTSFMEESRRFQAEMRENIKEIRESNARTDAQLLKMQQQAEKDREQAEKDREQAEKDREQAEKNREKDREESRLERISFNKRMAELSDSMGTLVEDMVVPNAERIASEIFPDDPVRDISPLARRRRGGESMELDLLAAGEHNLMVIESKRRLRPEDPDTFLARLKRIPEFFPEYARHRIVPVLASLRIEPSMVANLTSRKIYGLAFGDETMEVVNLGQF
jgi:hypothetical protein